ncbi:ATP-dependent DNA helicase DinG [Bacillaceae bacterium S4-13-58]
MEKFVVIDVETTGNRPEKGDEIIEIGMVTIENGRITDQYHTLVLPSQQIPPFITNLTGITQDEVKDAPSFEEVIPEILSRLENSYFVAHHVQFDLGFINHGLKRYGYGSIQNKYFDTVEFSRVLFPTAPSYKLSQLASFLDIQHENPHRALSDALVTAKLTIKILDKLYALPYETLDRLHSLHKFLKSNWEEILSPILDQKKYEWNQTEEFDYYRGFAIKKQKPIEGVSHNPFMNFDTFLTKLLGENGWIHEVMEGYEERPSQTKMAKTIYDAFSNKKHSLIEAETGTGKSLAYLLPAIFYSLQTGERVMVSTHTIQLQSQLLEKEIPLLKRLLPFPFEITLLKGKQHYLSLSRFEQELNQDIESNYDIALTKAMILIWLTETLTGDIDELQLPSSGLIFWKKISAEAEGVVDPKSSWFSRSFYQRARRAAQRSQIVITNHALLCTDIRNDYTLLPSYDLAIIDEAHHLENVASKHFGITLDYFSIQYALNRIMDKDGKGIVENFSNQVKNGIETILEEIRFDADQLFSYLSYYSKELTKHQSSFNDVGRIQVEYKVNESEYWLAIKEMANRLIFLIREFVHQIYQYTQQLKEKGTDSRDLLDQIDYSLEQFQQMIDSLEELLLVDRSGEVKWMEVQGSGAKNAVFLYQEPIHIGAKLYSSFFEKKNSVILTSATLTMKGSFQYTKDRLGLPNTVHEEILSSPYRYEQQVKLLIPNDFPIISNGDEHEFIDATCEAILSLAKITDGKMLVLFTSYDMLRKSYYIIKEMMDDDSYMVIGQGITSGSRSRLKKNFQAFDKAILMGTSSFWEGVDIPGEDLSCLVIVRLPFMPPTHPIYAAKAEDIKKQGKNPFMNLALPQAVIRFKQGFGRLIRSSTDRGIVFVCDQRIVQKQYGKYFLESLPKVPVTVDETRKVIEKASKWF